MSLSWEGLAQTLISEGRNAVQAQKQVAGPQLLQGTDNTVQ